MAAYGFDGTVSEAQWAQIHYALGYGAATEVVVSGGTASVGTGNRGVSISAVESYAAGVLAARASAVNVNHDANATAADRLDLIVHELDWTTNTESVVILKGGTIAPSPVKTAGTKWQVPLYLVTVRPSVTTFLTTDFRRIAPTPRLPRPARVAIGNLTRGGTASPLTIATLSLSDPGWPYYVRANATVRFQSVAGADGFVLLRAFANGTQIGVPAASAWLSLGGRQPATLAAVSAPMSGPLTATLTMGGEFLTAGQTIETVSGYNDFAVEQVPA